MDLQDLSEVFTSTSDGLWQLNEGHFEGCKSYCNGERMEVATSKECWGNYLWYCGNCTAGGVAVKCEGHWDSFHVPDQDMYVASCEGLKHYFNLRVHTCPKSGAKAKMFYGQGCLGGSSTVIKSGDGVSGALASDGSTLAAEHSVDPRLDSLLHGALGSGFEHALSVESRCKGMGGQVSAVKWGIKASGNDEENDDDSIPEEFEQLQAEFDAAAGGLDLVDADVGAPAAPVLSELVRSVAPHGSGVAHGNWSCALTCNGKQPWFHGMLPCWGDLTIECTAAEGVSKHGRALAAVAGHGTAVIAAPSTQSTANGGSFKSSCLGLWTGVFGHMCLGETMTHAAKSGERGSFDSWDICSGKLGVKGSKGANSASMGHWCRGSEVQHIAMEHSEGHGMV